MDKKQINKYKQDAEDQAKALQAMINSGADVTDVIAGAAPSILPVLDALLTDENKDDIKQGAAMLHAQLDNIDPSMLAMLAFVPLMIDKSQVKQAIKESIAQGADDENIKSTIALSKSLAASMSEADEIALNQAMRKILPKGLKAFADVANNNVNKSIPARVKEGRNILSLNSEQDLLAAFKDAALNKPQDLYVDAVMDIVSKINPNAATSIINDIKTNITPDDLSDVAINGLAFTRDVVEAAENGNAFDLADKTNARKFGNGVKKLAQAFEDAVVNAGLVPSNAAQVAVAMGDAKKQAYANLKR
ncbi:MAG: hypothetical protein NZ828_00870 [Alphaproteobacteria bacterium]|mgnify:CR=1 FL=1|nr:hypothetical protein [Alphaproteobacteria bacterium]MCS5595784.1 hypothetical protein [Alphaproteobacteria bacterium]|tara:strand:- start:5031 stop:5945 length:915 start_codon:yes stop_codon:yes gene_type:complete